jgi:ferredoxin-NADP reductase
MAIMNEYTLEVMDTIKRTPMSTSVRIAKPEGFDYLPGQWAQFTLAVGGGKESKPLSLSSSPTESFLEFTKRISGSDFSGAVNNLRPGDTVRLKGPAGNLVYTGGLEFVTFIAGGIGITPIRSILKYMADKEVKGRKIFLYGNLSVEETAYREEIEIWEAQDPEMTVVHVLEQPPDGWSGPTGFINRQVIEESVPDLSAYTFYVSGPPPMVNAINGALDQLNIVQEKRVTEKLEGYEGMV